MNTYEIIQIIGGIVITAMLTYIIYTELKESRIPKSH